MNSFINKEFFQTSQFARFTLISYLILLALTVIFGFYIIFFILFTISFIFLFLNFSHFEFFKTTAGAKRVQQLYYIFVIALILRMLMLFHDDNLTVDLTKYVIRSKLFLAGYTPYADFVVNKPPLYIYMLYLMGKAFGAGELQFRAFFAVIDSIVAVTIFYLALEKYDNLHSLKGAIAYAICPLPILMTGLWGHYEPVVMVFFLMGFIFFLRDRLDLSSLTLGIAFAFKVFPIILLPFLLWKLESWKQRIIYTIIFSVPMIISIIPIFFMSPDAFYGYIYEQTIEWPAKKSFGYIFEILLGIGLAGVFSLIFLGFIFIIFLQWTQKEFKINFWFKTIVVLLVVYYGGFITASLKDYNLGIGEGGYGLSIMIFTILYFVLTIPILYKFIPRLNVEIDPGEKLFVLTIFVLMLFLFVSSQFNPWYLLWYLPFVLIIQNLKIKYIILWLMFWNLGGAGILIIPGLAL
jgi:hypothetical protein